MAKKKKTTKKTIKKKTSKKTPTEIKEEDPDIVRGISERFYPKLKKETNGCWTWHAGRFFIVMGKPKRPQRVAYWLTQGKWPSGSLQRKCKNVDCVCPDHHKVHIPGTSSLKISAEQAQRNTEQVSVRQRANYSKLRDVAPIPDIKDPDTRDRCRYDLLLFLETYLPEIFDKPWSEAQLRYIADAERIIIKGGKKARAMPRGEGKTAISIGATIWAMAYGHRQYIYLIGDEKTSSEDNLRSIKVTWEVNEKLGEDFPEIVYPIKRLEGSYSGRAKMQTYLGELTYIKWSNDEINLPCLTGYDYDEDFNAGCVVKTIGIQGGVRGATHTHPLTGKLLRPDFTILDDVQTDRVAKSPTSILAIETIIDGAVRGLAGPGKMVASLQPCTVIREGDVSSKYLNTEVKKEWDGEITSMVIVWPEGMEDGELTDETATSCAWLEYATIRKESLRRHKDIRDASEHYLENQKVMDAGFEISWKERYNEDEMYGGNREYSAIQNAMNLLLEDEFTFHAEYQNKPKIRTEGGSSLLVIGELLTRIVSQKRNEIDPKTKTIVSMVDIQDESLWHMEIMLEADFSGRIIDYGVYPDYSSFGKYVTKAQTKRVNYMSREYFKHNSKLAVKKKAPLSERIYFALGQLCSDLLQRRYMLAITQDEWAELSIDLLAIDVMWGDVTDTVRRFISDFGSNRIVPYMGQYYGATTTPIRDYKRQDGWVFEDQVHPNKEDCKWYAKPNAGLMHLHADVNQLKTFASNRLYAPMGSSGSISIFNGDDIEHEMLVNHLVSEKPETVVARGRRVDEWKPMPNMDNELWDCFVGCMALGSYKGCSLEQTSLPMVSGHAVTETIKQNRKISEIIAEKRAKKQREDPKRHPIRGKI